MPELPEVETVKNTLKNFVINKKIENAKIYWNNIIDGDCNVFFEQVCGQTINDIKRYGKFLVFLLDDYALISHLRMEGKYYLKDDEAINYKHIHLIFELDDKSKIMYHDTRKFGKFKVLPLAEYLELPPLSRLAKEPWDMDGEEFYAHVSKLNRTVKQVLLDQHLIAGLGNIYANEVCFRAKVHPETKMKQLNKKQIVSLIDHSRDVLDLAISLGGTTIRSYTSSLGVTGRFQNELLVHQQQICKVCNSEIEKIKIGGRTAYFCPKCQKRC